MKTTLLILVLAVFFICTTVSGQIGKSDSTKPDNMNTTARNKEVILDLYENTLNNRRFERLEQVIAPDYSNARGGTGPEGFIKGVVDVLNAFPDAQWQVEELVAEGEKVMVKQKMSGTHTGVFQAIQPTGKKVVNEGFVIYEFGNGKIVRHQIQTDRFSFFQQLGVLPADIAAAQNDNQTVYFVDKFIVPASSLDEFKRQMQYNRDFIKRLPGFIRDNVLARYEDNGDVVLVTIAEWRSQQDLDHAKVSVQEEYRRVKFNPAEFLQRLDITMEREQYTTFTRSYNR